MATGNGVHAGARRKQAADAGSTVLLSKISGGSVPSWIVPRPRIDRLIDAGTRGPLTVITGPPGAGKTMALTAWAAARRDPGPVAWITVDGFDNQPQVFWSYVVAALKRAGVVVPRLWPVAAGSEADRHTFLVLLASALAAPGPPVIMVIEDLHLLTDAGTLDGLAYILKNATPQLRLVISSRIDPLLPLHRYRLAGDLAEIRAEDLAVTVAEARLLMAQHGVTLPAGALESLVDRTEGWAAGLRLAAISLDGHPDPEQFLKEFGAEDSAVTSYLIDEVLRAQPPPAREFLLRTSILDHISADIASELSPDHGADILPALAQSNAFIRPLGHGWYRYHPLFAAILRLKLRREHPDQVPDLHRRAAGWYRCHGYLTDAVAHAGAAGDWVSAARMVLDDLAVADLIEPRGHQSLTEEFRRMPAGLTWTQPHPLLVAAAMELGRGAPGAGASLTAAENILARLPAEDEIPARLAAVLIRMAVARQAGDLASAVTASAMAQSLLTRVPARILAARPEIGVQVALDRGLLQFWRGDFREAAITLRAGVTAPGSGDTSTAADCLGLLSLVEAVRGRLGRAADVAAEAVRAARSRDDIVLRPTSATSAALACVHLERLEFRQAHAHLAAASAALSPKPDKLISAVAESTAARACLAEGRLGPALELIGRARQNWSPPSWLEGRLAVAESRAQASSGEVQSAIDAAGRAGPPSTPDVAAAITYAWLAEGDHQAARAALAAMTTGPGGQREHASLAGWLADARLGYACGDPGRGRRSLERALRLGQPELLRLPFAMERPWLRPVLRRDPGLAVPYRQLLQPGLVDPEPAAAAPVITLEAPLVVERLSQREYQVLLYLSRMLSTSEIAGEMFISVNTVKTHLKSIYRKLSAGHRGEAVRRARQLGLILEPAPPPDAAASPSTCEAPPVPG